ncbi:MAG TPA: hypothetical protein VGR63_00355 [Casimicrobiaceae bacterium]|nr:hypothetical protein [Casimicrobiaceae bacterium]
MLRIPLVATLVLVAAFAAFWIAGSVGAAHKLAPLEPIAAGGGNYAITLDFAPERFHQQRLQDLGRVVEVRGATVYMKDVDPAALTTIARQYWVESIARWNG